MQDFGGTDSYTNAVSDIYYDNFDEGIFTGKGIYDVEIFHKVLCEEIPENTVLSHDLLEGNYLRCGLATDIVLLDDYPSKYISYITRLSRWMRGDWQIKMWLNKQITIKNGTRKLNPLNKLSRFKILDNLKRSIMPVTAFIGLIFSVILKMTTSVKIWPIVTISLLGITFSSVIDILNYIIFKKNVDSNYISAHKNIIPVIGALKASVLRGILEISFLPNKAIITLNSIIKTIYRTKVSKEHLLEWLTAEEAEKQAKTDIISYYKFMWTNVLFGILILLTGIFTKQIFEVILGVIWLFGPIEAYYLSKDENKIEAVEKISKQDKDYLLETGKKIWNFFNDTMNEENNFLPPDNYQEDRKEVIAKRTSPTNIGLRYACNCICL